MLIQVLRRTRRDGEPRAPGRLVSRTERKDHELLRSIGPACRSSLASRRPVISAVAASVLAGGALSAVGWAAQPASATPLDPDCSTVISAGTTTVTCLYTGAAQYFTVPQGVSQATVTLYGAQGGAAGTEPGGLGAEVTGRCGHRERAR